MTHPRRSAGDRLLTAVLTVLAALAAAGSVVSSPLFVMATDSCGVNDCDASRLGWAYAVTWGGVGLAVLVAVAGMITAARRGTAMWIWPALALFVVAVSFAGGFLLATSVVTGT